MSTTTKPKLVRQVGMVLDLRYAPDTEKSVMARALKIAEEIGIEQPDIQKFWQPYFLELFADYPLYLMGPGAPKIETCEDCLAHSNAAQFVVVIREACETNPT